MNVQLKSSLSKAFSRRGRRRRQKLKPVRSAGEAWSDTDTDEVFFAPAASEVPSGALSMPNSPSLATSRLRPTASNPATPSPCRNAPVHSHSPSVKSVAFRLLHFYTV